MKSLKTIQTLSKMGKTLSKIAFIFAIIGFCGCIAGLISLNFDSGSLIKIGGVTLHGIIDNDSGYNIESIGTALAAWLIICAGEIVLAWFANQYFTNEQMAGTPFTQSGATELKRLGILTICISLGTSMVADIVQEVVAGMLNVTADFATDICVDNEASVALGIMFIVISLLCRYGAELEESKEDYKK